MRFFVDGIQDQRREENQDPAINQINAQALSILPSPSLKNITNTYKGILYQDNRRAK